MQMERGNDPLLNAIREFVAARDEADATVRALVAYARELATTRRYRLVEIAEAAGMSVSGVRNLYGPADLERARHMMSVIGEGGPEHE
ncbi:hypothetical protein GCM10009765_44390 [Fodinicola feengrottensis]|uniref:Helix-turn-helix domain-containing protein n=2 Tax=Fodinicola feengrottensis TaxID=435914 RepID=A0ABN2HM50_9ACTN